MKTPARSSIFVFHANSGGVYCLFIIEVSTVLLYSPPPRASAGFFFAPRRVPPSALFFVPVKAMIITDSHHCSSSTSRERSFPLRVRAFAFRACSPTKLFASPGLSSCPRFFRRKETKYFILSQPALRSAGAHLHL